MGVQKKMHKRNHYSPLLQYLSENSANKLEKNFCINTTPLVLLQPPSYSYLIPNINHTRSITSLLTVN